ncbi:SgcJ/EcaC family oxidoreductase [Spiractinospora alimapuensis]|uniref:SgcJ/EcaC family oxidoreductase n=1 Tax=Spiractinospora alimapuensis TaxID=2820884 RepID=UPI001F31FB25|nr:SgcJ/EcaC family oxidoreductase [Spiractinospora alimapuensis]QVQ54383.1 SgcJ/EcaC family oxidoreductase [Spiractinospora alimapuensis]
MTNTWKPTLDTLAEAWNNGDAARYAAQFTNDATYIVYDGRLLVGRQQIEDVHRRLFTGPLRGSRMTSTAAEGEPGMSFRWLAPGVAHVLSGGAVQLSGSELTPDRASVVSFVLVERPEGWRVAAFQNTRSPERP